MAQSADHELIDRFEQFYRNYYREEIGELAQRYPNQQRSLSVEWNDLYQFDPDIADDYLAQPDQLREYAEEALRVYDLPIDVSLGQAHVRLRNLPETTEIRDIRSRDVNTLVGVQGIVRKATDVRPRIEEAAFECQRCGTLTYIPQSGGFQEPHECQGCERQGPFSINYDQSTFVDAQKLRVQESPEGLRGGETPQSLDVHIEDDITGTVSPGDRVTVTGVLRIEQQTSGQSKSRMFDVYMDGHAVVIEDEEFESMDITADDKQAIIELSSNEEAIYDRMVGSIAPTIYGYEEEKLAIALQLFSGVTKHLPDSSRIRGDLHVLLIGDPGTGKCLRGDTKVSLGDGSEVPIRELVEANLDDPIPVDDGVYGEVDFEVPSLQEDGSIDLGRATKVWKREAPESMYRVRTASGSEIEVTPSHPLFVQRDGRIEPRKATDLAEGMFVASPRRIPSTHDDGIEIDYRRSRSPDAVRLDLPDEWTPWLARLVGYVIAEGYVERRPDHTGFVSITNNDREVLDDVSDSLDRLGVNYFERNPHDGKIARELISASGELASFLEHLDPAVLEGSARQRVPDPLKRASPDTKAAFLKAYIEGEGHVSTTEREITVSSTSEELLDGVRSLLLAFGIASSVEPHSNGSYRLRISGTDFVTYVSKIGFVTDRTSVASGAFDDIPENPNLDVIPGVGDKLERIREALALSQFDCGVPRSTYQHYERGDRNPSRESLRAVVSAFERRLVELKGLRRTLANDWEGLSEPRRDVNASQQSIADSAGVVQRTISLHERGELASDGGYVDEAREPIDDRIDEALSVADDVRRLRDLAESDVRWDRIESIERVEPDDDWVYDLEVEGTHSYLSNDVVSHNSQLLQYIRHIAPRAVYTSGKGSSAAGLCVTGDTLIHTVDGLERIRDIAGREHPDPVDVDTAAEASVGVYTFDRGSGDLTVRDSSHVWRMPEKPCRRLETAHGKSLEASVNTPVLSCGESGLEWKPISEVEAGDYVAAPRYDGIERTDPPILEYLDLTNEKVKLDDDSLAFIRQGLYDRFGDLREAASSLSVSEDFIYSHLWNRFVPIEKLDAILDAIGATRADVTIERAMLRHGDDVRIPEAFDEDLMYLIGLVFGDGDIAISRRDNNRGTVRISNGDEGLLRRAQRIIREVFDKEVEIEHQDDRVPSIRLNSATIARFLHRVGMETPKEGLSLDEKLTTAENADAFIRGLMDADGSVSSRKSGGSSIHFSTISEELAEQVQAMLETYGIRARRRERDRRGISELQSGHTIESKHVQHHVELYGSAIDRFAEVIGFESAEKRAALDLINGKTKRREETIPLGPVLATVDGPAGQYHTNPRQGDNPGRGRARAMLDDIDLGDAEPIVEEAVRADLRWEEVVSAVDTGYKEVYDLTVPGTHNFVGNGIVTHNTAAAVRDDFGEGQQWSLEAGALVLADKGIAAIDELDKMRSEDRSALHEGLEQQQISISKAGINATLKSRCALLGAANPKYGRFDQYEPIAEQIDLEPALISRFDLIFTVTDTPNEEEDRELAEHILRTNYAGELNTQRTELASPGITQEEVDDVSETVEPSIDPELFRKYIAYAKRNVFPSMTEEAREVIRDFYVDLRLQGTEEDAPVPVTARKLEALVRLAEASARVRLSDTVEQEDAERVIDIVRSSLKDIGVDPETGQFDADVVETGTSKTQRDRKKTLRSLIDEIEDEYEEGAPVDEVISRAADIGIEESKVEHEIEQLKQRGELYEPSTNHLRTT